MKPYFEDDARDDENLRICYQDQTKEPSRWRIVSLIREEDIMRRNILIIILLLPLFSFATVSTSSSGSDCIDISGTWTFLEKLTKTSCSDEFVGKQYSERVTINQSDCTATMEGTRLKFDMKTGAISGSYREQHGRTKIKSGSLDLNTLEGSWSWRFTSVEENCRGSSDIALTR